MDFSKIPVLVLFIISLVCAIANSNYRAYYIKNTMVRESEKYSLNAGLSFVCAISLVVLSGFSITASWYSVLLGLLFGAVGMFNATVVVQAIKAGPFGYTMVIVNLSTALTALSGAMFWGESLGAFKIVGIVLMLISFFFAIDTENDGGKKANKTWFLLCVLGLLSCALVGIMQKVHQTSAHKNELTAFLLVSFLTSASLSMIWYFLQRKKENATQAQEESATQEACKKAKSAWPFVIALLICGIGGAGNNILNLYLSGVTDAAIFFPLVNGVPLLANLLVAFLLFKEKLKRKQMLGFVMGIVAIACLFI